MPRVLQFSLWYLWWTFTNSFNLSPSNDGAMVFYRKCLAQKARSKRESLQNSDKGEHLSLRYLEISIRQQLGCSNNCDSRYIHPSSWLCVGQVVTSDSKSTMVIFMQNGLSILHWFQISTVLLIIPTFTASVRRFSLEQSFVKNRVKCIGTQKTCQSALCWSKCTKLRIWFKLVVVDRTLLKEEICSQRIKPWKVLRNKTLLTSQMTEIEWDYHITAATTRVLGILLFLLELFSPT